MRKDSHCDDQRKLTKTEAIPKRALYRRERTAYSNEKQSGSASRLTVTVAFEREGEGEGEVEGEGEGEGEGEEDAVLSVKD
ncbi:unnamed protein product [Toxocara canis]|uniref:Uncharacterized protein n=1 Tax=Toxocara canis TaxID=6265 RepID=A0A183UEM7_TOXCA|nr:unnamed protein product [Toxocara canis]